MTNARFARLVVWINGAVPASVLVWDASHGQLGANPVNFAIRTTGLLALIFLIGSLAITPIRQIARLDALIPHRRTLGLYAAFYAFAHFSIFFWWDRERSIDSTIHEIFGHPPLYTNYLIYGLIALLIFIPLTLTSTAGMIRRLGPANWKRLHRLVYLAAIFGSLHYLNVGKFASTQSKVIAGIFGLLLLYRVIASHVLLRRSYNKLKATAAATPSKPKFWTGELKLACVFRETPEVQTFRFVPPMGRMLPFEYRPGQYLNLALNIDGKKVNRSYTIASSPTRAGYCEITVKREEAGTGSKHLHDMLKTGDVLKVSAPAGKFTFTGDESSSVVLIAGGVGITPLMSKLRYLTDLAWPGEIYFIFIARTEADIIFRHELDELKKRHRNLHVTITLTRAEESWHGDRGRLNAESLKRVVPNILSHEFHICGPDAMAAETRKLLADLGVPEAKIKFESFTPPSRGDAVQADEAPAVASEDASLTFAKSGQTVDQPDGESILELAENNGIEIPFDCRSGICGTCKIRLQAGHVAMDNTEGLTAADRKDGLILACQARCLDAVTVDA
ncbi:MAG: Oxidoreductase FAD-binding domain protein [Phycisphaerales bacterium]|nr:Oxidoreductase FAD-binding domain protein [Phycisphaerales bacterium]